jgi:hypothetical protein
MRINDGKTVNFAFYANGSGHAKGGNPIGWLLREIPSAEPCCSCKNPSFGASIGTAAWLIQCDEMGYHALPKRTGIVRARRTDP